MKIMIVNGAGETLGEMKLSQELLRRPEILSDRLGRIIESAVRARSEQPVLERIVENSHGRLEDMDDDSSIMDVPLNLTEACQFDFSKHVKAISEQESTARVEHEKYTKLNYAQENSRKYDARYKERPGNRIRYK